MPWELTKEGWILNVDVDQPEADPIFICEDDYLKVTLTVAHGRAIYQVRVDKRRRCQVVADPEWIALFFGHSPRIRPTLRGQRLWRDKQLVIQGYGRKHRSYILVSR